MGGPGCVFRPGSLWACGDDTARVLELLFEVIDRLLQAVPHLPLGCPPKLSFGHGDVWFSSGRIVLRRFQVDDARG